MEYDRALCLRLINLSLLPPTLSNPTRIDESEADKNERLEKWQKYLENEDAKKEIAEENQQSDGMDTSRSEATEIDSSES